MLERLREARENEDGFTLIELLIVIVVLGVLAGIVVFAVGGITDRGEKSACEADVKTVEVAAEAAFAKTGNYPANMGLMVPEFLHEVPSNPAYTINYAVNAGPPKSVAVTGSIC